MRLRLLANRLLYGGGDFFIRSAAPEEAPEVFFGFIREAGF
jgi:hypothetical protein